MNPAHFDAIWASDISSTWFKHLISCKGWHQSSVLVRYRSLPPQGFRSIHGEAICDAAPQDSVGKVPWAYKIRFGRGGTKFIMYEMIELDHTSHFRVNTMLLRCTIRILYVYPYSVWYPISYVTCHLSEIGIRIGRGVGIGNGKQF